MFVAPAMCPALNSSGVRMSRTIILPFLPDEGFIAKAPTPNSFEALAYIGFFLE